LRGESGDLSIGDVRVLADLRGDSGAKLRLINDVVKIVNIHDSWE
jgi:hypothetical protein